jgi:hypothetical protein
MTNANKGDIQTSSVEHANFYEFLASTSDQLEIAVKAHYQIDRTLNSILTEEMPYTTAIDLERVSFLLKVHFSMGLGALNTKTNILYKVINAIRNKFAHDPYHVLSDHEAQDYISQIRSSEPRMIENGLGSDEFMHTIFRRGYAIVQRALKDRRFYRTHTAVGEHLLKETIDSVGERNFGSDWRTNDTGPKTPDRYDLATREELSRRYPDMDFSDYFDESGVIIRNR